MEKSTANCEKMINLIVEKHLHHFKKASTVQSTLQMQTECELCTLPGKNDAPSAFFPSILVGHSHANTKPSGEHYLLRECVMTPFLDQIRPLKRIGRRFLCWTFAFRRLCWISDGLNLHQEEAGGRDRNVRAVLGISFFSIWSTSVVCFELSEKKDETQ